MCMFASTKEKKIQKSWFYKNFYYSFHFKRLQLSKECSLTYTDTNNVLGLKRMLHVSFSLHYEYENIKIKYTSKNCMLPILRKTEYCVSNVSYSVFHDVFLLMLCSSLQIIGRKHLLQCIVREAGNLLFLNEIFSFIQHSIQK